MPAATPRKDRRPGLEIRPALGGGVAATIAWGGLQLWPSSGIEVFARGAASLASLLTGSPVERVELGWLLNAAQPVVVSEVCSATGYFIAVAAMLGWGLASRRRSLAAAVAMALVAAFPLTLAVNALRVVAVMQAHRWVIPHLPEAYAAFLHLLAGVAVFLPALIGLNLIFEFHGKARRSCR